MIDVIYYNSIYNRGCISFFERIDIKKAHKDVGFLYSPKSSGF